MAEKSMNTPVEKNMFSGNKPSGANPPVKNYPAESSINSKARNPSRQEMDSPAPSKFLGRKADDGR